MAYTYQVSTSIEINAPPELVRRTLLDFPSIPQWASAHIKSIQLIDKHSTVSTSDGNAIDGPPVGSKLKVELAGMTFNPIVVANTEQEFAWLGSLLVPKVLFDGRHSFVFKALGKDKTELVQSEQFQGVLCTLMKWTSMGQDTNRGFEAFNEEIKKRAEALYAA